MARQASLYVKHLRSGVTYHFGDSESPFSMKDRSAAGAILAQEASRWEAKPAAVIIGELREVLAYTAGPAGAFQVEVELLEDTHEYVHVMIAVDDGSFWGSIKPLSTTVIVRK